MNGIIWVVLSLMLHVWPGIVRPVHGQGTRKDDIVFNSRGVPLAGASIHVCNMPATGNPCSPTALIYSDPLLTQALANPTTSDGMGNYFFYAAPGQYEIEISGPGITTKQIPNVILPSDPANPTFSSISATGGINAFTLTLSGNLTVSGSTTVSGNLASGTLNLTNQNTPPGAAGTGTVNLYTKLADKKLYYKDETGTETGPLMAGGAQTNQSNTWTATQNFDADTHSKGPNPWYDITRFGGYIGPNFNTPTTCSISSGSRSLSCASALDFVNGNGILVYGAGPATGLATPQAPTVTPLWQAGSTSYSYCIASIDYYGGVTPCSSSGTTSVGPSTFGQNSYSISSRSSTGDGTTVTITTASAHNIPTTPYHLFSYPQIEITGMSGPCNTDATITSVPSTTTFTISQQGLPDTTSCSGGNVAVRTEVELKWDNHQSLPITNYTCSSGNTASITVPALWTTVTGAFPGNLFTITGSSDGTYLGHTFSISSWATVPTVQFSVTCNTSTDTGNFGGSMNFMQGHAVKAHLIYRCQGSSCALPANASNYSLVGVSQGDDTYFIDKGYGVTVANIDLGQYPSTAPTTAQNQYLDTTIASGGGTTSLTLASSASTTVSSAKTWHDNVPNIYAACAAIPNGTTVNSNGGAIYIPAPPAQALVNDVFPVMANLIAQVQWAGPTGQVFNCQNTELRVAAPFYQAGTIEWNGNITGIPGGHACLSASYNAGGPALPCFQGNAYPLFHFEPFLSGEQSLTNMEIQPDQNYQAGLLWDQEPAGNGSVGFWLNNVHSDGNDASYPVIVKSGFGWFWKNGGWSAGQTEYAGGRDLLITTGCGASTYQSLNAQFPYIFHTEETYHFGTAEIDDCGTAENFAGDYIIKYPLSESIKGTAWKFNSISGIRDFRIDDESVADNIGPGGPTFDFTNAHGGGSGAEIVNPACAGPLLEVLPGANYIFKIISHYGKSCPTLGIDSTFNPNAVYSYEALQNPTDYKGNYTLQLLGANAKVAAGQLTNPTAAPSVTIGTTACGGSFPLAGTYTYAVAAWDAVGGETLVGPATSGTVLNGSNCPIIAQPTLPVGSVYWSAYAATGPQTGNINDSVHGSGCGPSRTLVQFNQIIDSSAFKCGGAPPINTSTLQAMFQNGFYGNVVASTEATEGQCFSSASPAACGALIDGFVAIPAGSSSVVVNTTSVTANSVISLTFDVTQGSNLGVTCNTSPQTPYISARTAGTSLTIAVPSSFSTNPGCIGFHIRN